MFGDDITEEDRKMAKASGIALHLFDDVVDQGRVIKKQETITMEEAKPDDVYLFNYTSGTTGDPKAVKITHKMMMAFI